MLRYITYILQMLRNCYRLTVLSFISRTVSTQYNYAVLNTICGSI